MLNDANGTQSLVLHHVPTNSQRTIVQDPAYKYDRVTFSPDGSYIYFRIDAPGQPRPNRWDEYRIPVLGGQLTRVITGVDFPLTFINGGQRVCFYRKDLTAGSYQFLSANADGSDQQVLANGKKPFPLLTACSPSGKFAVLEDATGNVESLEFGSGSTRTVASSAALTDSSMTCSGSQTGKVSSSPSGKRSTLPRSAFFPIPRERCDKVVLRGCDGPGIGGETDARIHAQVARFAELPLAGPLEEEQTGELVWFTWLDNNTIVANGGGNLRVINLLKHETTAVNVKNGFLFGQPSFCGRDTMVLVGAALQGDIRRVYTLHLDGSGLTQVTKGPMDSFPECTVDGEWVFYADASEEKDTSLMRQSLRGGAPQKLAQGRIWFDVSSVGKMLATAAIDKGAPLQIVSLDSLRTIRSFATRDFDDFVRFAFSADDRSIFYVTRKGADATIWRQPLDTATPVKVATLPGRTVNWIRPSPDGKKLGLILEAPTSEAVLLHDVR